MLRSSYVYEARIKSVFKCKMSGFDSRTVFRPVTTDCSFIERSFKKKWNDIGDYFPSLIQIYITSIEIAFGKNFEHCIYFWIHFGIINKIQRKFWAENSWLVRVVFNQNEVLPLSIWCYLPIYAIHYTLNKLILRLSCTQS